MSESPCHSDTAYSVRKGTLRICHQHVGRPSNHHSQAIPSHLCPDSNLEGITGQKNFHGVVGSPSALENWTLQGVGYGCGSQMWMEMAKAAEGPGELWAGSW